MKIGDPYVRKILNKAVSNSRELESFIFETNSKLSQLNARIDEFENTLFRMETAINQCQYAIDHAFEETDRIKKILKVKE